MTSSEVSGTADTHYLASDTMSVHPLTVPEGVYEGLACE